MRPWFTTDRIDRDTYCISEYRHWEETHCYLLSGAERSLLIDTGLGICDIAEVVSELTALPVTAVATHLHWDHIGGHKFYPDFYAHAAELPWLQGGFPQTIEEIRGYVTERCDLPEGYDVGQYTFFKGPPPRCCTAASASSSAAGRSRSSTRRGTRRDTCASGRTRAAISSRGT